MHRNKPEVTNETILELKKTLEAAALTNKSPSRSNSISIFNPPKPTTMPLEDELLTTTPLSTSPSKNKTNL